MAYLKDTLVAGDLQTTGEMKSSGKLSILNGKPFHFDVLTGTGVVGRDAGASASPRYIPGTWTFNAGVTLEDGDIFTIKIPVAGTTAVWMSVDGGITYHPVALHGTTRLTTQFAVGFYITVIYQSAGTVSTYAQVGADSASTVTGVFRVLNYYDSNTTYSAMSVAEMKAGTATSARTIRADYLKSAFTNSTDGIIRTGTESGTLKVFGTDIAVKDCGDFVITATISTSALLQGQVSNYQDYSLYEGTSTNSAITIDKTLSEVREAVEDGKNVYMLANFPFANTRIPLINWRDDSTVYASANFSLACYGTSGGLPRVHVTNIIWDFSSDVLTVTYFLLKPMGINSAETIVSTSGAVTQELQPDTIYHFTSDALTSLTLTFPSGEETKQYHFDFISPSTAITLTLPQSVEMPQTFSVEANTKYEIDILNNLGIFATWVYEVS